MTKSSEWIDVEKKYYAQTVRRQPVVLVKGEGTRAWDADGKEYLDFVAGWAVNQLGHCHPAVTKAIADQAATLMQVSNQFYSVPQLQLAETLVGNSALDLVFFGNSGAEANEGAVKLDGGGRHLLTGSAQDLQEDMAALADAGVVGLMLNFQRDTLAQSLDAMQHFADEVRPGV